MFNLFFKRQKAFRYLLTAILGVVALSMVVYLIPGFGSTGMSSKTDDPVVAEINGKKITTQQVVAIAGQVFARQNIPPEMLEIYMPQFIDMMLKQRALTGYFEDQGLTATDDETYNMMTRTYPQFFQNGQLVSKDQFEGWLGQQGLTLDDAIEQVREAVVNDKIQNLQFEAVVVSAKDVDEAIGQKFDKAKIKYVAFPSEKFKSEPKVTTEEMQSYFNARRGNYTIPEKRTFQVLTLDQEKVAQSIQVTDAQLKTAYNSNLDNFRIPERVHVEHILLMTQNKSDAEKKTALTKAQDVLKQAKSGANFEDLARKYSEDTTNAPKGGDLGWVVHGQMVAEFEKGAFALQKGQISEIVTSPFGYHVIKCLERDPARLKPFDEVKVQLADDLKKQGVGDKMQTIGDQMHAALEKSPGNAPQIAQQFGANVIPVNNVEAAAPIPTLGVISEIDQAINSMKKNEVSSVLVLPNNRIAIVVLNDKTPSRQAEFNEVEAKVRDEMLGQKAEAIAADKAKEAANRMKAGEDMAKVAKSMGLSVTESIEFTHSDSVEGLGSAVYVADAFTKPVGQVVGPVNVQGRNVIYQIVDQVHVDPSKLTNERQTILKDLKQDKVRRELELLQDSVFTKMVADKKVNVHKDAVKQILARLRR